MTTEQAKPLIEVKHLCKTFSGTRDDTQEVLEDISVDFYEGDVAFIVGPSGAGKSTFLRCLNRLEEATSGEILFEGVNILDKKVDIDRHRQKMGMVFQQFNLFPHLNVMDNLTIGPIKLQGLTKQAAEERATKLLERVKLANRAGSYPNQLSGGQSKGSR